MVTKVCPHCNERYIISEGTGEIDFVHECNSGNATVDNEDVPIIGDWEDYTGSGIVLDAMRQGSANKLFGTRADIEGENLDEVTRRGAKASTHRQRKHLNFIKLKGGN